MWTPVILLAVCFSAHGHVLPDATIPERPEETIVQYAKHFRQIISDYITTQYATSADDLSKVASVLDEFFKKLAADLNEVMNNNDNDWDVKERVEDGLPDEKFDEIKRNIQEQYPEIKEKTVDEIMYRLRTNLYDTKRQLDLVMKKEKIEEESSESEDYDS